jgi:signal transduction histidine kinase/DNA-binding NarL/FixJ family response regulator
MVQNDGSVRWVLDRGVVIEKDSRGLPLKIIGTHTNITEQKQLEELLIKAKEEALELAKTKELFLANMSHEIRTPLNAIIGMVRELKHTALDSTQMQLVKNADASSDHLFSLVNNVLDLSKIDSGNFELNKSVFCWNELFAKVNAVTQKSARDKQLELTFENRVQANEQFVGDAGRIRQVLFNVIGNAIKFTEKGHVLVQCRNGKTVDHQRELIVSISDTGIGMDPTFLASIFDKFTQENNSIQRKYGGTGLGMSITKQLVERMGGRIEVDSELGGGTRFVIYFLLEQADPLAATMDVDLKTDVSLTGKKILVVEDNEMNRLVAKSLLARHHAEVLFAENGLVAIDQVKLHRFDLILMDLQMPVMDGLEAAAQIRKMKINTPIIAFTANAFKTEIDNALRAGMDDFVAKPFDERTLLEKMKGALSKGKTGGLAITKEDTSDEQESISAFIDEAYMDEISGGSAAFRKEMFKIFHKQSHEFLDQSADLIIQQKWADLIRVAHQFKPQGSYLGAKELTQIVARIEKECKLGPNISTLKNDLGAATEMIKKINREIEVKLSLVQ